MFSLAPKSDGIFGSNQKSVLDFLKHMNVFKKCTHLKDQRLVFESPAVLFQVPSFASLSFSFHSESVLFEVLTKRSLFKIAPLYQLSSQGSQAIGHGGIRSAESIKRILWHILEIYLHIKIRCPS